MLDPEYYYLPKEFRKSHDQCFLLIRQIEEFITNNTYDRLRLFKISFTGRTRIRKNEHIFDYLLRVNRKQEHDELIRNQVLNSIIIDICYFLQEALLSSKKKRLTVTFALLRKPFVYDLIALLRLMFEKGFLDKFNFQNSFDVSNISEKEKKILIRKSLKVILANSIKGKEIYDYIFNQDKKDSIVNISNRALHLSTTRSKKNKTEIQNLNFVFSTDESIQSQWRYLYSRLPLLLFYYVQILEIFVFSALKLPPTIFEKRLVERIKIIK